MNKQQIDELVFGAITGTLIVTTYYAYETGHTIAFIMGAATLGCFFAILQGGANHD